MSSPTIFQMNFLSIAQAAGSRSCNPECFPDCLRFFQQYDFANATIPTRLEPNRRRRL